MTAKLSRASIITTTILLMVVLARPTDAGPAPDDREERDRVRDEQAANAAELDLLRADETEIADALAALDADVRAQEASLEDARRAVHQAERDLGVARAAERAALGDIAELEGQQRRVAIESYMRSGSTEDAGVLPGGDVSVEAQRRAFVRFATTTQADIADQLNAAREDLADERARASEAADRAAEQRDLARRRLADLEASRERQLAFASEVNGRIEARLAEAAALDQLDRELSQAIATDQAALAAAVPVSGTTPSPGGSGNIALATVRGITVASSIAGQLASLLDAASAAGITLGGSGYRDPAQQMALRQAHCPDPINSPPSACTPPTARPGASMHERGLAIDFTSNGALITSRSSAAFQWLAANAGRYGLRNLPSEPWHWSTNGQ